MTTPAPARWEVLLQRVFGTLAALMLFAMMALTFVDVIGRYFLDRPVPGAFEVTELLLASLVYLGLPLVTLRGEHVSVDLFERFVPAALRPLRDGLVIALCAVCAGVGGWQLWRKAGEAVGYGDTTAVLQWPLAPVFYLGAVCFLAMALAFVWLRLAGRRADAGEQVGEP